MLRAAYHTRGIVLVRTYKKLRSVLQPRDQLTKQSESMPYLAVSTP